MRSFCLLFPLTHTVHGINSNLMWGVALQNMSSQEDPAEMSGCPVAPIGVAVVCHCVLHITASFDERKGTSCTAFRASADQPAAVRCGFKRWFGTELGDPGFFYIGHSKALTFNMLSPYRQQLCHMVIVAISLHVKLVRNLMAHAQKPDFIFPRNGRVHLNWWGRQFNRLLAAEVCASA